MSKINPYEKCPIYETESFMLRLIQESDAEDLLDCYSDPVAVKVMNSDFCTSDFHYTTLDEMRDCIKFWLSAYTERSFVRFSILEKNFQKAVGTIEIFGGGEYGVLRIGGGGYGVLRIDLKSSYEKQTYFSELITISNTYFYDDFQAKYIITKAIPEATQRIPVLVENGFIPDDRFRPGMDYYMR